MKNSIIEQTNRVLMTPLNVCRKISRSVKKAMGIKKVHRKLNEKGIRLIVVLPPMVSRLTSRTKFENDRIKNWTFDFNHITEEDAKIISQLYPDDSVDILLKKYDGAKVIEKNGYKSLADFSNEYVNIVNGHRITPGQPEKYKNTIYMYGACTVRGTGVGDDETIPSYLQEQINADFPDVFRCVNQAIGCGSSVLDDLHRLNNTVFYKGDIAIICNLINCLSVFMLRKGGVEVWDSAEAFEHKKIDGEWFTDLPFHTNKVGNKIIASYIFSKLKEKDYLTDYTGDREVVGCLVPDETVDQSWISSKEFTEYIHYLRKHKVGGKNNGAIVMNCNPFTLGHRYLIEKAVKDVDNLYIFVVEEDKSFFPFEDRFELVNKGVADLPNVHVLRSGKFIISALTFPGYFYKDENIDAIIDTSQDVDLFARYIATELGIIARFAGEEPLDPVTRQYNETMSERLPMYGVRFCEIKRKTDAQNVISASRVRAAIKSGDWKLIGRMVPQTTLEYLERRFK